MRVKNWKKFQHFKDRKPPWIKLYRDVLEQRDINLISDCSFRVLIGLWILASEDETQQGLLPSIPDIAFKLRQTEEKIIQCLPELTPWIDDVDINPISPRYHDDINLDPQRQRQRRDREEESREKEKNTKKEKLDFVETEKLTLVNIRTPEEVREELKTDAVATNGCKVTVSTVQRTLEEIENLQDSGVYFKPNKAQQAIANAQFLEKPMPEVTQGPYSVTQTQVKEVFEFWKEKRNYPDSVLDMRRNMLIADRLTEGNSVDKLKKAILGIANCPHNMGENATKQIWDSIQIIFKDASNVDRFAAAYKPPRIPQKAEPPKELPKTSAEMTDEEWREQQRINKEGLAKLSEALNGIGRGGKKPEIRE